MCPMVVQGLTPPARYLVDSPTSLEVAGHFEAAREYQAVNVGFGGFVHEAAGRYALHALRGRNVEESHVRPIERGIELVARRRPLAHVPIPGFEDCRRLFVLNRSVDACSQALHDAEVHCLALCQELIRRLRPARFVEFSREVPVDLCPDVADAVMFTRCQPVDRGMVEVDLPFALPARL